jgi:hypothetical protein
MDAKADTFADFFSIQTNLGHHFVRDILRLFFNRSMHDISDFFKSQIIYVMSGIVRKIKYFEKTLFSWKNNLARLLK